MHGNNILRELLVGVHSVLSGIRGLPRRDAVGLPRNPVRCRIASLAMLLMPGTRRLVDIPHEALFGSEAAIVP